MKFKKILVVILIVLALINGISVPSFAYDGDQGYDTSKPLNSAPQENGSVDVENDEGKTNTTSIKGTSYSKGLNLKVLAVVLSYPALAVNDILDVFVDQVTNGDSDSFTICDMVLGKYDLFNIDYTSAVGGSIDPDLNDTIKYNVVKYYTITRSFALAISLFMLIYVGIRIAISAVASEKAKYQKMLLDWLVALILIFVMQFIVIMASHVLQFGLEVINNVANNIGGVKQFEEDIYGAFLKNINAKGLNVIPAIILVYMITWYQLKFFIYYFKRALEVNFLIIVSPLVTITYPVDKMGDGKAQAFGNMVKEVSLKCSIQLVHALVYVVFIASAGLVAKSQPLLAMIFFGALSRAEKILRNVVDVKEDGFEKTNVPFM